MRFEFLFTYLVGFTYLILKSIKLTLKHNATIAITVTFAFIVAKPLLSDRASAGSSLPSLEVRFEG